MLFNIGADEKPAENCTFLEKASKLTPQKSDGMPYSTHLQIGAVYFLSTNIDVSDGLFNGATGILRRIDYGKTKDGRSIPVRAWIEFQSHLIGVNQRLKFKGLMTNSDIPETWTPIQRITKELSVSFKYSGLTLRRQQIPLISANAMTIAKVQFA